MSDEPSPERYRQIEELIASDDSPVGIDAKKTHVLILDRLMRIEERLARLERSVAEPLDSTPSGDPPGAPGG